MQQMPQDPHSADDIKQNIEFVGIVGSRDELDKTANWMGPQSEITVETV